MFLASNTVAMVTHCVTKMVTTCTLMVGQFFDTMIVASSDKGLCLNPTAEKDNRGVLVVSFRVKQFLEICRVFQYGGL